MGDPTVAKQCATGFSVEGGLGADANNKQLLGFPVITKHTLKMSGGVRVEMEFNEETGQMSCAWHYSRAPTAAEIRAKYVPWRNKIFADWSKRTGLRVLIVEA